MTAPTMDEALAVIHDVYQAAVALFRDKYGMRPLVADEGGLAPAFASVEEMLGDAVDAIARSGHTPGRDVALAVDVASSHFFEAGRYALQTAPPGAEVTDPPLDGAQMIERVAAWVERFPIVSVEDGLAEDDWAHWPALRARIGGRALVLGDDLLCTNPARIDRAAATGAASALLLKVNQIGSVTEAAEALRRARAAGFAVTVSARSGETEDDWLADLAVGWAGDQIKIGSITRSERLAKYNRLLEIEADTHLPLAPWPAARPA
jgi:enolase